MHLPAVDLRRSALIFLTLLAAICPLLPSDSAVAQQLSPVPPVPDTAGQAVSSDNGYWVVGSQNSVQSFDDDCPRFCPIVARFDRCQGYRHTQFSELCQSLEPGVPVCIMVHGSFVDWDSMCYESQCTWEWLASASCGRRMQMIYLTWPSDLSPVTPLVQLEVNFLGRRAARNGYYLAELVRYIPPDCPICLIGHSHGTRVISSALQFMAGGDVQGMCHPNASAAGRRIRTVFAASAIDHDWFNPGERYCRALASTECLLNLQNPDDPALKLYPLRRPLASRALGAVGFTEKDRCKLRGWSAKVIDCDVSGRVGHTHLWPHYFRDQGIAQAIHNFVYFPDVATNVSYEFGDRH